MGYTVASYSYDAWGVPTLVYDDIDNIGSINPLRYRGYYYDNETGFYYVSSRYYDPEIGRWINADSVISGVGGIIQGYNQFAYCINNPINCVDPSGRWMFSIQPLISAIDNVVNSFNELSNKKWLIKYDVPLYDQGGYSLCWAFCQIMIESFQEGVVFSQEQAEINAIKLAQEVNGENWNRGNWPTNIGEKVKINSYDQLYNELEEGPVYAHYYNYKTSFSHLIVITGTFSLTQTVYYNNPWGTSGMQTFKEFRDSFLNDYDTPLCYIYKIE